MPIALNDLRRNRRGLEAQQTARRRFDRWWQVGERTHGTGNLADGDDGPSAPHAFQIDWSGDANRRANAAMDAFLGRVLS